MVFGIKKFHNCLFDQRFTLCTDHKPLQSLLNASKAIPTMASTHIQWWALLFPCISVQLNLRVELPMVMQMHTPADTQMPSELVFLLEHLSTGPLTAVQIKTMICKDPILSCM